MSKSVHVCQSYSKPKVRRFLRHGVYLACRWTFVKYRSNELNVSAQQLISVQQKYRHRRSMLQSVAQCLLTSNQHDIESFFLYRIYLSQCSESLLLWHRSRIQRYGTARHCTSGRQPNFAALNRGRHLYSAGRPSRWALAHIQICFCFWLWIKHLGNRWTHLCQIHRENMLALLLVRIWMSRSKSKVKVTRQNALCTPITPDSDIMERARFK